MSKSKWVKDIRGLPSDPSNNDYLKVDYIDVNLGNSRKVIQNINQLTKEDEAHLLKLIELNESLIKLNQAKANLQWLDKVPKTQ